MGVPSFYRWLSEKYPKVVVYVKDEMSYDDKGEQVLPDCTKPNPNGIEFDNLYLDMNGIIHPCAHPEKGKTPENETEMIRNVFAYIDHVFSMVRPRKLLFLAIDGVAPRAKMNQQRSRRFRAAQERVEFEAMKKELRARWTGKGLTIPSANQSKASWDSNVITPGTPFMDTLAKALRVYLQYKLNSDPAWADIMVILSDANVPGEGEHKIMQFIRRIRTDPGYDRGTRHILHGLDADLFMLALATHEPNFSLLREEVLFGRDRKCNRCGEKGHFEDQCKGEPMKKDDKPRTSPEPFQFAHVNILREYLQDDLRVPRCPFWEFERVLDDFVFMCFFVGNDFLPHLPSLEIREGAIDHLMDIYRQELVGLGGFLTKDGDVDLKRVCVLLKRLGAIEDSVFRKRAENERRFEARQKQQKAMAAKSKKRKSHPGPVAFVAGGTMGGQSSSHVKKGSDLPQIQTRREAALEKAQNDAAAEKARLDALAAEFEADQTAASNGAAKDDDSESSEPPEKKARQADGTSRATTPGPHGAEENGMKDEIKDEAPVHTGPSLVTDDGNEEEDFDKELKRQRKLMGNISERDDQRDTVKLGSSGWKERYYKSKLGAEYDPKNPPEVLKRLFHTYAEGLKWVFRYYYDGCPSWTWFFPFHYSPFASDLVKIYETPVEFNLGVPFAPLSQLMGVLPAASGHCLPLELRDLMSNPESPIIDFYPEDFKLDLNGKKFAWQAVALLPFIDEERLLTTINPIFETMDPERKRMNSVGETYIFMNAAHSLANSISAMYLNGKTDAQAMDALEAHGIVGFLRTFEGAVLPRGDLPPALTGDQSEGWNTVIPNVSTISAIYELPKYRRHITNLLDGAKLPAKLLSSQDIQFYRNNRRRFGSQRGGSHRGRDRRNFQMHTDIARGQNMLVGWREGQDRAYARAGGPDHEYQPLRRDLPSLQDQFSPRGGRGGHFGGRGGRGGYGGRGGGYGGRGGRGGYDNRYGGRGGGGGHSSRHRGGGRDDRRSGGHSDRYNNKSTTSSSSSSSSSNHRSGGGGGSRSSGSGGYQSYHQPQAAAQFASGQPMFNASVFQNPYPQQQQYGGYAPPAGAYGGGYAPPAGSAYGGGGYGQYGAQQQQQQQQPLPAYYQQAGAGYGAGEYVPPSGSFPQYGAPNQARGRGGYHY